MKLPVIINIHPLVCVHYLRAKGYIAELYFDGPLTEDVVYVISSIQTIAKLDVPTKAMVLFVSSPLELSGFVDKKKLNVMRDIGNYVPSLWSLRDLEEIYPSIKVTDKTIDSYIALVEHILGE